MTVASHETVSYFVLKDKWSDEENRPKTTAFKRVDLSVWREGKLAANGASMNDLRIGPFVGCRHVSYLVEDIIQMARQAELSVEVVRRIETDYVFEPWQPWSYAHAQIEEQGRKEDFPPQFRLLLAEYVKRHNTATEP